TDMPNFFVEAITISSGKLFTDVKEIEVPPESRVLDIAVEPSSETYKPGQKATVNLKITDSTGKPFLGSRVLAIYDKSVEYISGVSKVKGIKAFFWKWRRMHYIVGETNLMRIFANFVPEGKRAMESLGIFGETAADEYADRSAAPNSIHA